MELLSVHLKNIRSFEEVRIPFGPGIVRITGENGAGKSTILASVAYAVLGSDSIDRTRYVVDQAVKKELIELDSSTKLLRRGQPWGLVAVEFQTARAPGRRFRLHRILGKRPRLGRRGAAKPTDPIETDDAALVELGADGNVLERIDTAGKSTILAAVAGLLDLTEDGLAHAFKRIVAAPQGRLLQAVFEENKARRDIAWKILGVDRYARAAEDATRMGGLLEKRYAGLMATALAATEQEVAGLADAPELVKRGEIEEIEALAVVENARVRRLERSATREEMGESLARARERSAEGARLLVERDAVVRETLEAETGLRAATEAASRQKALEPAAARHEALLAGRPAIEARVLAHTLLRSGLEAARARADELARRDAADAALQAQRLAEAEEARASYVVELERHRARSTELEATATTCEAAAKVARAASDAFGAWLAPRRPALARLVASRSKADPDALEALAKSVPAADGNEDRALVASAHEIEDAEQRASRAEAETRGLLQGWKDLEGRVGEGGQCPFLVVPCPHERGKNLRSVVQENAEAGQAALRKAAKALTKATAARAGLDAARKRIERAQASREKWLAQVMRLAPAGLAWVEAWDRERAVFTASESVCSESFADLRAFESALVPAFAAPAAWDAPAVAALALAVRARCDALSVLPASLEARLEARRFAAEKAAARAEATRERSGLDRVAITALLRDAPARLAGLEKEIATQVAGRATWATRSAEEARARAADLADRTAALAAQGDVPGEAARFRADLDLAQKAKDELNRLFGLARAGEEAKTRLERLADRAAALAGRVLGLENAVLAEGSGLVGPGFPAPENPEGTNVLAGGVVEALARRLQAVATDLVGRLAIASKLEQESEAALRTAESHLSVKRDRLGEARRRAEALVGKRAALVKLREARDHVAHACSVLRGGGGEGPLAGTVYRALVELPGRLADRRVREVSGHARKIYRALAPAESWDLVWDPRTYVLALGAPNMDPARAVREGIAVDDMSGGQQMSAALALHLALVHTYARNCDLLFLDEPTTHLDAKRRRALAECLRSLRARVEGLVPLRQVIVISHDEAFDALHDHVIRVVAGAGDEPSHIEDGEIRLPLPVTLGAPAAAAAAALIVAPAAGGSPQRAPAARSKRRTAPPVPAPDPARPRASPQLLMAFGDLTEEERAG